MTQNAARCPPEPVLLVDDVGPVRRLTLNRPEKLNALSHELVEALSGALAGPPADDGRQGGGRPGVRPGVLRRLRPAGGRRAEESYRRRRVARRARP